MKLPVFLLRCLQTRMTETFLKNAFHPSTDPALVETSRVACNKNNMAVCKYYQRHHQFATQQELSMIKMLAVLVLHGDSDGIIPKEGGQHLADCLGGVFRVVDSASHQLMEERPLEVASLIKVFVEGLEL